MKVGENALSELLDTLIVWEAEIVEKLRTNRAMNRLNVRQEEEFNNATRIYICRHEFVEVEGQPDYNIIRERYPCIDYEKGWCDEIFDSLSLEQRNILVLNDQMGVASSSTSVADLFTKESHNRNLTVFYVVQNAYNEGKSQMTISLNSHYSMVFRNGRDASRFRTMAYQICPNDGKWLVDSFTDATSKWVPYYLVLYYHPSTPEDQTVVTNILPGDQLIYYINSNAKFKRH